MSDIEDLIKAKREELMAAGLDRPALSFEQTRELYLEVKRTIEAREVMVRRIFSEPRPHAVAEILRRVRDADGADRETAIVDGTVAIMALFEGS